MSMVLSEVPALLPDALRHPLHRGARRIRAPLKFRGSGSAGGPDGGDRKPPKKALVDRWRAWLNRGTIGVECGSSRIFEPCTEHAAIPAVQVEHRKHAIVLRFDVPGSTARNSQVIWDEKARLLAVGVWHMQRVGDGRSEAFRSELVWHRSCWLPYGDGSSATASVHEGVLEVVIPNEAPSLVA